VETTLKMAVPRAALFAAVVVAGAAAPAVGQAPDATISVEAPRAQVQAPPSPLSVLPDAAQAAAFRISGATGQVAGQPQPMPPGNVPPAGSSAWLAPPDAATAAPSAPADGTMLNRGNLPPTMASGPHFAGLPAPPVAPAWRWHGYGGVNAIDNTTPTSPSASREFPNPLPSNPSSPPNQGADAPRSPSEVNLGSEWKLPGTVPAFAPATDPVPPPSPSAVQPLTAAEAAWQSGIQRVGYAQPNPMTAGPAPWVAVPTTPNWHEWTVTLDAPRPAGTYISRAVSEAVIEPAAFSPPTPAKTTTVLPAVRTIIERACVGRVRDVEIVTRGTSSLLVRLKVRQAADAEYVANTIARLTELAPYQVLFEMQVVR
jgi:hypothetical protein